MLVRQPINNNTHKYFRRAFFCLLQLISQTLSSIEISTSFVFKMNLFQRFQHAISNISSSVPRAKYRIKIESIHSGYILEKNVLWFQYQWYSGGEMCSCVKCNLLLVASHQHLTMKKKIYAYTSFYGFV